MEDDLEIDTIMNDAFTGYSNMLILNYKLFHFRAKGASC